MSGVQGGEGVGRVIRTDKINHGVCVCGAEWRGRERERRGESGGRLASCRISAVCLRLSKLERHALIRAELSQACRVSSLLSSWLVLPSASAGTCSCSCSSHASIQSHTQVMAKSPGVFRANVTCVWESDRATRSSHREGSVDFGNKEWVAPPSPSRFGSERNTTRHLD